MSKYISGIGARFYRGIGEKEQLISPFTKMNFFIGPNNAGKSIVLNLICNIYPEYLQSGKLNILPTDRHLGLKAGNTQVFIGTEKEIIFKKCMEIVELKIPNVRSIQYSEIEKDIKTLIDELTHKELIWTLGANAENKLEIFPKFDVDRLAGLVGGWQKIWNVLSDGSGGQLKEHWIPRTVQKIADLSRHTIPRVLMIPAKRQLGERGESFNDLSGKGLIDHLATLQNPSFDKQVDREKFKRINTFVQEITGKPDAQLEIPSEREHLLVHLDGKVLPLSSLGTGVHEVVLIAAFCTIYEEKILCIEEPEIHLHPLLQKKLVHYLMEKTNNQYFIATHSSAFIDTPGSSVFHVINDGSQTHIKEAITKDEQRIILDELGYRASDILQSNAVIWVEGPSDRIYLNHWVHEYDANLIEGVHYTVMFYGGALIRHLTASDAAISEFINIRDLNRNMAILIDSDREQDGDALKPHAQRLSDEMNEGQSICWVTAGREVENYVDGKILQDALRKIHPKIYKIAGETGRFDHAFYFARNDPTDTGRHIIFKDADKVGAANEICKSPAKLDILDLRERIGEVVEMIRKANGLSRQE
ncbi:hypothetical protein Q669_09790 [Labrenzia sp. C1B10]|uniref:AAA family ATPase n=1 Tax=unclassified Labrenzia TaxID=2648686 RepID=UPI0003B8D80B|nr:MULTISPECIES: AAA family ATPase [unclassified Labrenzia]ERP88742.1 hypothetical protein Q669_09790 [Labrenzia sp. C1B10]ERP99312.1 hypothetical protein Q675_12125 [Labrenzia sp. C1B70]